MNKPDDNTQTDTSKINLGYDWEATGGQLKNELCATCKHYRDDPEYLKDLGYKSPQCKLKSITGRGCDTRPNDRCGDWVKNEGRKTALVVYPGFLKVDNYLDNVELFYEQQPFFYNKTGLFWFWNFEFYKWELVDEVDLMIAIEKQLQLQGQTVSRGVKSNYVEAFKRVGRQKMPEDAPKSWIQFKDIVFDIDNQISFPAKPNYFFCNPIPWVLSNSDKTPVIDTLFEQWVGKSYVQSLYEIIAYCCLQDYPIHLIFCFTGSGSNGKSKYQGLVTKFIGGSNVCSTELDVLIDSRFESFKLFKKLVCVMGETNFGLLKKTSLLKKLTGQDLIGFEYKNKAPFDAVNYAKVMISSNSLPSSDDTSDGFYRRWFIIDFPNTFGEGKNVLKTIPEEEFNNLAKKVVNILPDLIKRGDFTNQGSIEDRKNKYIAASNPINIFLHAFCEDVEESYVLYGELYNAYVKVLKKFKKRIMKKKYFGQALNEEGFIVEKKSVKNEDDDFVSAYYVVGLKLKDDFMTIMTIMTQLSLNFPTQGNQVKVTSKLSELSQKEKLVVSDENVDIIYHKCTLCGRTPTQKWVQNKPYCIQCISFFNKNES